LTRRDAEFTVLGALFQVDEVPFLLSMEPLAAHHRNGYRIIALKEKPSLDLLQIVRFDWSAVVSE